MRREVLSVLAHSACADARCIAVGMVAIATALGTRAVEDEMVHAAQGPGARIATAPYGPAGARRAGR